MDNNKTAFIDTLRWLATAAVVYYHVLNAAKSYVDLDSIENGQLWFNILAVPLRWHVPTFLMISGALFLNRAKEITYKALFEKYIKRLLLSLLVFGFLFSLGELVLTERTVNFPIFLNAGINLLAGNTWSHMWYLYMLIGVYLLIPLFKRFLQNATPKDVEYLLLVLFVFTSVFPAVEDLLHITIGFSIPLKPYYILYFLMGYHILYNVDVTKRNLKLFCASITISCTILLINAFFSLDLPLSTGSPVFVCITASIFYFFRHFNVESKILTSTKGLCFGVYLVHMVFVNLLYKVLHFSPFDYPVYLVVPLLGTVFMICSIATTWVMVRIPYLKNIL